MQRRQTFRLVFPVPDRPRLVTDRARFEVINVSEGGIRFRDPGGTLEGAETFEGRLVLANRRAYDVEGRFIRVDGEDRILRLTKGPSVADLLDEQRRLIRRYRDSEK